MRDIDKCAAGSGGIIRYAQSYPKKGTCSSKSSVRHLHACIRTPVST